MSGIPAIPIHFAEVLKTKVWGGRRLETLLGKTLPNGEPVGESWEISDHAHGESRVDEGDLAGTTLHDLVLQDEVGLIGRAGALEVGGRFPLLFKFIDAADWLSVQVHPTDAYARTHEGGDPGKTEAWVVIDAEPGAKIACGLVPGTTRDAFARAIADGTVETHLRFVEVTRGDVVSMPSGVVHALGPGVLVAEIQQNSDTTYRVYDWGRVGLDGKPRELHIEKALDVINFGPQPEALVTPAVIEQAHPKHERLVANDQFTYDRYASDWSFELSPAMLGSFVILTCIHGRADVQFPTGARSIRRGQTVLLPAALDEVHVAPDASVELLAMSLPLVASSPLPPGEGGVRENAG